MYTSLVNSVLITFRFGFKDHKSHRPVTDIRINGAVIDSFLSKSNNSGVRIINYQETNSRARIAFKLAQLNGKPVVFQVPREKWPHYSTLDGQSQINEAYSCL